jgi:hypothetical protein
MGASKLELLLDSTVTQFKEVQKTGTLTLPQVLKIATTVAKDIYTLETLTTEEKKAVVLMALQRGLDSVGPLKILNHVDPALASEVEKHVLHVAVMAIFGLGDVFPHAFAGAQNALSYVRSYLSKYLPFCSQAAAVASTLDPKDTLLIAEAVKALKAFDSVSAPALEVRTVETNPQSVAPVSQNEIVL